MIALIQKTSPAISEAAASAIVEMAGSRPRDAQRFAQDFQTLRDASPDDPDTAILRTIRESKGIDELGLSSVEAAILRILAKTEHAGIESLRTEAGGEDPDEVSRVAEPRLVHLGLIRRATKGREITEAGRVVLSRTQGKEASESNRRTLVSYLVALTDGMVG